MSDATPPDWDNPSRKDEESKQPYNEQKARQVFGDEYVERLMKWQKDFCGDWWQLAFLMNNLGNDAENPDIKPEDRLREWNQWSHEQRKSEFFGGWVEKIHLERADLSEARLEHVIFYRAHLEHAIFTFAHLEQANLFRAYLHHANIERAHLDKAGLLGARLEHADLLGAHLDHADLRGAYFKHAVLKRAQLNDADLREARFENTILSEAVFDRADVRRTKGLLFDDNRVEQLRIEGNAPDPWSVLRRKYTGPLFFVHLILLILFFLPYAGQVAYLTAYSRVQEWGKQRYTQVEHKISPTAYRDELKQNFDRWFEANHTKVPAWQILLGVHRGWWAVCLTLTVIMYNMMRGYLTFKISNLREAEERSSITPRLVQYYGICSPLNDSGHRMIWHVPAAWLVGRWPKKWNVKPLFVVLLVFAILKRPRCIRWIFRCRRDFFTRASRVYQRRRGYWKQIHWREEKERDGIRLRSFLMSCLGLYRIHMVTSWLMWVAIGSVIWNITIWVYETEMWMPIGGG